ncbi:MAG: ABC transporter ATP-binding protein [Longimicrobiales bacterium]
MKTAEERLSAPDTFRFLKRLWPRLKPYRGHLAMTSVLILVGTAIGLAFPLIVRTLLDAAFLEGSARLLNLVAIGLIALFAIDAFVHFLMTYLTSSVSERVVADLRLELFDHLVGLAPGFFESGRVAELGSRFSSDAGQVQDVIRFGIPELLRQGLYLVGALVLVTITHAKLTLVTMVAIPFAAGVALVFGKRVRGLSTRVQDTLAGAVARAEQVFDQIRVVQGFGRAPQESVDFGLEMRRIRNTGLERAEARAALVGAVTFAAFGAVVLVLWQGGRLVLAGELTPGTLVAFLLYAVTIAGSIASLAGFWTNLQEAAGSAARIFELLDEKATILERPSAVVLQSPVGLVRYEEVSFRYGEDQPWVLKDVSFELTPGSTVALVGVSGAGKSTIAGLLPRFYDVGAGRITIDGTDIRDLTIESLRALIGVVPQEPTLFAGSIAENLLYARPGATGIEMKKAAKLANANGFILGFPHGYDQIVGERGVTLSAGQRQRIAIARMFLKRPKILLLDEASSALDSESEELVQDALSRLMADATTLVIAHRLSTVRAADRILVLDQGHIRATGRHRSLLEQSPVYRRLYQRQWRTENEPAPKPRPDGPEPRTRDAYGTPAAPKGSPVIGLDWSIGEPDSDDVTPDPDGGDKTIPLSNQA